MSCLDPPVTAAELAATAPGEDDDWMCRACDARVDAFYALNAVAETHVDAATATWRDVFPAEAALSVEQKGPGQANDPAKNAESDSFGNALLDADWASDESDDEDFGGDLGALSDDGADDEDEPLSGSARGSGDDLGGDSGDEAASSGRPSESASPEVLLGKRRRAPVDYRKLNDEMFGTGEAFEGEAEDEKTGGWGPASPKKKKSVARLGKNTANAKTSATRSPKQARVARKNTKKKRRVSAAEVSGRDARSVGARVRLRRETRRGEGCQAGIRSGPESAPDQGVVPKQEAEGEGVN